MLPSLPLACHAREVTSSRRLENPHLLPRAVSRGEIKCSEKESRPSAVVCNHHCAQGTSRIGQKIPPRDEIGRILKSIDAVRDASGEHPDILNLTFHRQPNDGGVIVQLRMSNDDTGRAYH